MEKPRVSYFNFPGGRGEPIRMAFFIGGIDFEDVRINPADWGGIKSGEEGKGKFVFGTMPTIEMGDRSATQSNCILRYVGKMTDLYPKDEWLALKVDEMLEVTEEFQSKIIPVVFEKDPQKRKDMADPLIKEVFPKYLGGMNQIMNANKMNHAANWAVGDQLTVADLKLLIMNRIVMSAGDVFPESLWEDFPILRGEYKTCLAHPKVVEWAKKWWGE